MLHRAYEVSTKQRTFSKLFIPLIVFVIIYIIYLYSRQKYWSTTKPPIIYPAYKKKCGELVQYDPIIKVQNHKTYMVGSYVEHREVAKIIRTIAVVQRSVDVNYYCLLCCKGMEQSVPATSEIHSDHFGFDYGTADINCQIPQNCSQPNRVAIISQSTKDNNSLKANATFQPVKNQERKDVFSYEFTVCISVMYDYDNVLEFVQAMEMFKILGVQRVAIYKTSCRPDMKKILEYYVNQNFVELIPWNIKSYVDVSRGWQKAVSPGELHYYGQIAALNDCVYRYMYESRYVALQDLDELILPINLKNWKDLLPELERKYNHIGGFEFENHLFPISVKDSKTEYFPDSWKNVKGVNILEHIIRLKNDPTKFNNFKVIVNPRFVFKATVHGILQHMRGTVRVDPQIARMYHIRNVTKEMVEQQSQILDMHLRDYAYSLIPAVSEVLHEVLGEFISNEISK